MIGERQSSAHDLGEYRAQARAWITSDLERLREPVRHRPVEYYTPEVIAENRALQRTLWEAGYAGIDWPVEFGGQGLSAAHAAAFLEEAKGFRLPDFGILTATTFEVCVPTMIAHARPEFLEMFVPKVLAGEALVCQYFSEPAAGSDLAAVRTRAVLTSDGWVLNGQKVWSTMAHLADWGMCLARTDWDVPKHRGLTWFAVPCRAAGVTTRPIKQINETLEFCEEFFEDVRVPDEHRLSEVNGGWAVAQTMLTLERGAGHAEDRWPVTAGAVRPELVELAERSGCLDDAAAHQLLAQTQVIDVVERALRARIQERADLGRLEPSVAAYGKLFQGTYDPVRARIRVELGGADALGWSPEDAHGAATAVNYLDARVFSIAGGTNEVQRNSIAERGLGLPREPSYDTHKPFRDALRDAQRWGAP
jgi:alkylation response protein AidB-like acyl-CoA dehydrogenase